MPPRPILDWSTVPLGAVADAEIARQLGVTRQAVAAQRGARNIPALGSTSAPPATRAAMVTLEGALQRLLDGDAETLWIATATSVDLVPGWGVDIKRTAANRLARTRFRTGWRRTWSEWMTPRRARAWLLQAGWADAAAGRIEELRAKPEEATA